MANNLLDVEPKKVFKFFSEICSIPHGSGNLDKIVDYLINFAKERNLEYITDDVKNVIIKKKNGNTSPIILQAHTDMVCVKKQNLNIDMSKDPIKLVLDGNKLQADGTSLGADDGIGVAIILSLLDLDDEDMPSIEALFTADEETGMNGAIGLDGSLISGKELINIDSEEEGVLTVSCAGGSHCESEIPIEREKVDTNKYLYQSIHISGLIGGHSGMEIHKGRANAIIELAYVLKELRLEKIDYKLISIDGGRFENVICSDANAIVLINKDDINKAKSIINKIDTNLKDEYKLTDCNIKVDLVECEESKNEKSPIKNESTDNLINAIISLPQGLIEVSQEFINLPWTSLNLGVIETKDDRIIFITFIRSNNDIKRQKLVEKYKIIINKFSGKCNVSGEYPAWQYNKDSMLKNDMIKLYSELYSKDMEVVATHGGLECGILIDKIKGLDAVSVGPLLKNVHSVDEVLYVDTVKKVFDFLYKFLKKRA